jgi:hypothetical protein
MHRLTILESKLGKLAMEVEMLQEKDANIFRFLEKSKTSYILITLDPVV